MDNVSNEKEPFFNVEVNGKAYEFNRHNSTLWTFLGRSALDHLWLEDHIEDDTAVGTRFFRELFGDDAVFNRIALFMVEQEFESHINLREVPDADMEAYIKFSTTNIENLDTFPDDWV